MNASSNVGRVGAIDTATLRRQLDALGYALTPRLLDETDCNARGGRLTLVESRARMQRRCESPDLRKGRCVILPVRDRPRPCARGFARTAMRHGVSTITRGQRHGLSIIFHDAR